MNDRSYYCRICGFSADQPTWDEDGIPSENICDCCGAEFGYEDCCLDSIKKMREKWLKNGAKWFWPKAKPENWSLEEQMKNIPEEFR